MMGGDPLAEQVRLVLAPFGTVNPRLPGLMMGLVTATERQRERDVCLNCPKVAGYLIWEFGYYSERCRTQTPLISMAAHPSPE